MLANCGIVAFVPTLDRDKSRSFYVDALGLPLLSEDEFAMTLSANGTPIRVVTVAEFTPDPFTIVGWDVPNITTVMTEMTARGVVFERYEWFEQDLDGVWIAPSGTRIAWFRDPDGNLLSVSQHSQG